MCLKHDFRHMTSDTSANSVSLCCVLGEKVLFTKGAESSILPYTKSGEIEKTRVHVDEFALVGSYEADLLLLLFLQHILLLHQFVSAYNLFFIVERHFVHFLHIQLHLILGDLYKTSSFFLVLTVCIYIYIVIHSCFQTSLSS